MFGTSALNVIEAAHRARSQRYLQLSVLSIKQIASLLSYQDAAYFSRFSAVGRVHRYRASVSG